VLHTIFLSLHIAAGSAGLLIGPAAMLAPKRPRLHPRLGLVYQGIVAVLACSAVGLVSLSPARLWPFAVIAGATETAALAGWFVRRRHRPGWLPWHVSLMCGSYVSFLTGFLVVNWSRPLAWALPSVIGSPLIALASRRAGQAQVPPPAPTQRQPARSCSSQEG
jgi:hypothetical protein